uniref:Polyadenylate-binding protein 1 n=1 Tax=Schistosoma haematobium TaxID=6185 RepID=A0A094ZMR8_SCHHA
MAVSAASQGLMNSSLYVGDLHPRVSDSALQAKFSEIGPVLSARIVMDENGQSKGYGFVHFEKEECAERAIEKINNMIIRDRVVYVGKFIPKTERKSQARKVKFNNLYIKNFPPETDNEKLKEMFSEFGEIKSACVMKDSEGKSKGFGFVCFLDPDHAENAVKTMHGKEVEGRALYCARAQRKEERQEELKQRLEKQRAERQSSYMLNVNLYVKNLDDNIDDKRLEEAFSVHGSITSAKVMKDANNRSKGFGFVCFANPEQAARAVTDMNGTIIGSKPLYVALAQRKEDRRAKLIEEHQQRLAQYRNPVASMIPAVPGHAAPHSYFPPAFQQAQRFYHPSGAVLSSQPRWNRAAGIPAQIGGLPNRPPVAGYYAGAPNPAAITANQMASFAQFRTPGVNRPMVPNGMSSIPSTHLQTAAVFNQTANQQRQQASGRQGVVVPQQQVASQVPRAVMHSGMSNITSTATNVRFHQTARNVSAQPTLVPAGSMSTLLQPLGDQGQLTISALAQLSEEDQKRTLGEHLYPRIKAMYPNLANKLTGMLLGVDNAEVINLLESEDLLRAKCEEGINVLRSSQNQQGDIAEGRHTSTGQNGDGSTGAGSMKPEDSNN